MKNLLENSMVCKLKAAFKKLAEIRIKNSYDMTVTVYDESTPDTPECTHKANGTVDVSLVKLLAVFGVVSVTLSAICCVRSFFRD